MIWLEIQGVIKMKKVVVGMSGGVDSSVCAYLLKEQGYEVIGATMQLWRTEEQQKQSPDGSGGVEDILEARKVAECLGIPHYVMNFYNSFQEKVVDKFTNEYLRGMTPNPCVICNRQIKWGEFHKKAIELGADYIATGHYGRILKLENGRYTVKNSVTCEKDQTYVLYALTQDQLAHTLMPVGDYEKSEIRKIAEKIGLPVAHKKDSQDICFIDDGDYAGFIESKTGTLGKPGKFVTADKKVLGEHTGTVQYTIGQRKGLGIAVGYPLYVCAINAENGEIKLGKQDELFSTCLYANDLNYMGESRFDENKIYHAKVRYSQDSKACRVTYINENEIKVDFLDKVRAITPGQALVLYTDDWVAGGGTISRV
jgi:tRNA-specific 2-thiouridylase